MDKRGFILDLQMSPDKWELKNWYLQGDMDPSPEVSQQFAINMISSKSQILLAKNAA